MVARLFILPDENAAGDAGQVEHRVRESQRLQLIQRLPGKSIAQAWLKPSSPKRKLCKRELTGNWFSFFGQALPIPKKFVKLVESFFILQHGAVHS